MAIKRKTKEEKAGVELYSLCDGEILKVRKYIDDLIELYGEDAKLDLDWYYDDVNVSVKYLREETEVEAKKRIEAARKARERRKVKKEKDAGVVEAKERKELARLLKKYED